MLNIDNTYFEQTVDKTYLKELQLNNAHKPDIEALFLFFVVVVLSISNDNIIFTIYDKQDYGM